MEANPPRCSGNHASTAAIEMMHPEAVAEGAAVAIFYIVGRDRHYTTSIALAVNSRGAVDDMEVQ